MENFVPILTELGLPGAIIGALAWAYWQKDKQLQQSNAERIKDAERLYETGATMREVIQLLNRGA